jgi:hypothetical protein
MLSPCAALPAAPQPSPLHQRQPKGVNHRCVRMKCCSVRPLAASQGPKTLESLQLRYANGRARPDSRVFHRRARR